MKKSRWLPALALAGGAAGFFLRLGQNRTGYDPATGLPIPESLCSRLLPLVLAALAIALFFLSRPFPVRLRDGCTFRQALRASPISAAIMVGGALLWLLSGGWDLAAGLGLSLPAISPFTGRLQAVLGALTLLSALALAPAIWAAGSSRMDAEQHPPSSALLLIPVMMLVLRLIAAYRVGSANPVLSTYYPGLLALSALTLGFFRLASFSCGDGRPRRYAYFTALALVLCMTATADGTAPAFFLGGGALLLGFLLALQPQTD